LGFKFRLEHSSESPESAVAGSIRRATFGKRRHFHHAKLATARKSHVSFPTKAVCCAATFHQPRFALLDNEFSMDTYRTVPQLLFHASSQSPATARHSHRAKRAIAKSLRRLVRFNLLKVQAGSVSEVRDILHTTRPTKDR